MMNESSHPLLNKYFVCPAGQDSVVAFNPFSYNESDFPGFIEINYLARALQELENQETISGKTVYITWDTTKLPSYGEQVVVILMGDEWCHLPKYLNKVRVIFRQYGVRPELSQGMLRHFSHLTALLILQYLRALFYGAPGRAGHILKKLSGENAKDAPQYVIPLGYANQLDLPIVKLDARPLHVYFAGSIGNQKPGGFSLKHWLQSPKNVARQRAIGGAKKLAKKRPDLSIQVKTVNVHVPSQLRGSSAYKDEAKRYSEKLMECKICLVPRGSSPDTPRFFEALRFGCIAVGDPLPDRWFYRDAPLVEVRDWDRLDEIISNLLGNPTRLNHLHRSALEYWQNVCSERALGLYLAEKLKSTERLTAKADSKPTYNKQHLRPGG